MHMKRKEFLMGANDKKLKIAILGQGRSGRDIHAENMRHERLKDKFQIAAIAEPLEKRRERAKNELGGFGCEILSDYTELFGKAGTGKPGEGGIDLVVNAAPSHLHAPITLDLLNHGFNVLCEKPFAKTAAEVDAMIGAAAKNGRVLTVFQQYRYFDAYKEIKRVVGSGVLGRIVQMSFQSSGFFRRWDWQTLQEYTAGSLYNTGPHMLDMLLQLIGFDGMPDVKCYMDRVNTFGDAPDYVKLIMSAPGKPVADLEISACNPYPKFQYSIQGEFGGLCGNDSHLDYRHYVRETAPERHLTRAPIEKPDGTPAYCSEELEWVEESWDRDSAAAKAGAQNIPGAPGLEPTVSYYEMLYGHMVNGAPLEVTPQQVRQQIAVIEECHRQNPMSMLT